MMSSKNSPPPFNLLKYHRPKFRIADAARGSLDNVPPLSEQSKRCLQHLAAYRPPKSRITAFPRSRCAAVLVALFVGRKGDLYVLLSRRSATLRSYAGDTSLPGGKVDPEDATPEDTARREAFEEIGLPRDRQKVPLLCVLEPFLTPRDMLVTPIVALILDNTLRPILNAAEVTSLFSHPLASFLSNTSPFTSEPETIEVPYHTSSEWTTAGPNGQTWRSRGHQFLTGREAGGIKPVVGLTAAILIRVAAIGYNRPPEFELDPPDAPTRDRRIAWAMLTRPVFKESFEKEGLKFDRDLLRRLADVSGEEDVVEQEQKRAGVGGRRWRKRIWNKL